MNETTPSDRRTVPSLKGSCLCGAIQWQLDDVQLAQICVCHCGMCRRLSGSTFIPFGAIERAKLWPVVKDFPTLKSYQSSSTTTRYFCGTCSSAMVFDYHFEPNSLWVPLGSLQDLDPSLLDSTRDSLIFVNDQASYETTLKSDLKEFSSFGLYKSDPCQPCKKWDEIPTFVSTAASSESENQVDLKDLPGATET
ncbi:Glutathione-dependent formaldehyde-activating enzyme [Seminavis robusta]|uniref:Glutathione-dependent formaldehyde-activating enzyme n=1 Tax=Seminavis robusta TaxID=568900 RepID=A0A9N8DHN6_9STRA|nr:Glutathione-dependent formaldehyde-activating enzyme [Seminavis robusta]|eukprot:Sro150_g068960.1 Glutathione-dependent formaldehyde-activating enzyme (195) ;mRNA; f:90720-91304